MEAEEEGEWGEEDAAAIGINPSASAAGGRRIKKRSLRNKALSVGFDEKDLRDYVTGFHKRKKKRRKIAQQQLQEKERLQRIQARKRKVEKELALYGGPLPAEVTAETALGDEEDGDGLQHDVQSGTKMYEHDGMTTTVRTSELSCEEDLSVKHHVRGPSAEAEKSRDLLPKKKPLKKVTKQRSHKKHKKPALQRKGGKKGRR